MQLHFYKYQGAGNDFIILDNRNSQYNGITEEQVKFLCDRRFGIGADGLMMLNSIEGYDFEMKYHNADGRESSMCGNGGRCLVKFAAEMGILRDEYRFLATDGEHEASITKDGTVRLKMKDVYIIEHYNGDYILDTGSPHYVKYVNDIKDIDVVSEGMEIRYSEEFAEEGINVNFVEIVNDNTIRVRTYERGVENETFSCGTGVTACALIAYHNESGFNKVNVETTGGKLCVEYDKLDEGNYENIWLCGPAEKVFEGNINL